MSSRVYRDFNLSIKPTGDGKSYHAEVIESAGGDGSAVFTRDELPLNSLQYAMADSPAAGRHLSVAAAGAPSAYLFEMRPPPDKETAQS